MNLYLFIAIILAVTLIFGRMLEKIRVPWVFAALFVGLFFSVIMPNNTLIKSDIFLFLSNLGMYLLLFIIGLELDLKEIKKQGKEIIKLSFFLIFIESFLGALFIHYIFNISWGISILTASSFATVGEAILIPILDEFKIIHTKIGQYLLSVGTLDDLVELVTIVVFSIIIGKSVGDSATLIITNYIFLGILFIIPFIIEVFKIKTHNLIFQNTSLLFIFGILVFFAFLGIGQIVEASTVGAIFAGISLKNILSDDKIKKFESIIKSITFGLFVPLFFISIGYEVELSFILKYPIYVLTVLLITSIAKVVVSWVITKKILGAKKSLLLGIGLSAKFSTSIVVLTLLRNNQFISIELFSVLIGAMLISQFIIPVLFSSLLNKWRLEFIKVKI